MQVSFMSCLLGIVISYFAETLHTRPVRQASLQWSTGPRADAHRTRIPGVLFGVG